MRTKLAFASLALGIACGCRDGSEAAARTLRIVPNGAGVNGCSGPNPTFTAPQVPVAVPLATLVVGPSSQITAAGSGETLFATGANGQVVAIDVSGPTPVELEVVAAGNAPGTVGALLEAHGITTAPDLSGIAVLDANYLVAVEGTSNTLVSVLRAAPFTVDFFAGEPDETPGFADGFALGTFGRARFSFDLPTQVCPTGEVPPSVFVADAGNHAIRLVAQGSVVTIAGNGRPGFDVDLPGAQFDAPTGLSASCGGALVVSERGGDGEGNRIREVVIGTPSPFGGFSGTADPIVGDGTAGSTGGVGTAAQVDAPVSPLVTSLGETLWIDSGTGVLRRRLVDGTVDCPLDVDCTAAVGAPSFPPRHELSLTQTPSGVLFVLDATDGVLYRVTP
jgi:hypothetical protein